MRALLYHCRHHLEAEDDETFLGLVREHLVREHPAIPPTDEQVAEMVATRAYDFEYVLVGYEDGIDPAEEFGPEPY
jgi:hypothetical protein